MQLLRNGEVRFPAAGQAAIGHPWTGAGDIPDFVVEPVNESLGLSKVAEELGDLLHVAADLLVRLIVLPSAPSNFVFLVRMCEVVEYSTRGNNDPDQHAVEYV
jgi:hypothetical protein